MVDYKRWLFENKDIKPYVFVRKENRPRSPGGLHEFEFPKDILIYDPLKLENSDFASAILALENTAFKSMGLTLPRWALYDCSILPGLVVGFAMRTEALPKSFRAAIPVNEKLEWTPISLFICIPAVQDGHWVAHNLCSMNSLVEKKDSLTCLGFLSKAFGLWYFNISNLYGVTQWKNTALGVHTNFGLLQLVTAYTPIHSLAASLTYLVKVDSQLWHRFVEEPVNWNSPLRHGGLEVRTDDESTMVAVQKRLEKGEGPFFLSPDWEYKNPIQVPIFVK